MMSVKVGRRLTEDEIVAHKEGRDDSLDNLVLYTKEEYSQKRKSVRNVQCVECDKPFVKKSSSVKTCSRKCAIDYRQKQKTLSLGRRILICKECAAEFSSTCNHAKFCSSKCRNANMDKIRKANRPVKIKVEKPKVIKPPKVKVPKVKQYHQIECVVCERQFQSTNASREICYDKKCAAVIAAEEAW
jgi:hypothetical protein